MFQYKSYIRNVRRSDVADLVAGKVQRQQLLVLLWEIAESWTDALRSNIGNVVVPQRQVLYTAQFIIIIFQNFYLMPSRE